MLGAHLSPLQIARTVRELEVDPLSAPAPTPTPTPTGGGAGPTAAKGGGLGKNASDPGTDADAANDVGADSSSAGDGGASEGTDPVVIVLAIMVTLLVIVVCVGLLILRKQPEPAPQARRGSSERTNGAFNSTGFREKLGANTVLNAAFDTDTYGDADAGYLDVKPDEDEDEDAYALQSPDVDAGRGTSDAYNPTAPASTYDPASAASAYDTLPRPHVSTAPALPAKGHTAKSALSLHQEPDANVDGQDDTYADINDTPHPNQGG